MDKAELESLKNLAFYLEGIKSAKGNLEPLGNITLEALWSAYSRLRVEQNVSRATNEQLYEALDEATEKLRDYDDGLADHLDIVKAKYQALLPF